MPFQAVLWGGGEYMCVPKVNVHAHQVKRFEAASRHYPVTSDACAARHEDVETFCQIGSVW